MLKRWWNYVRWRWLRRWVWCPGCGHRLKWFGGSAYWCRSCDTSLRVCQFRKRSYRGQLVTTDDLVQ